MSLSGRLEDVPLSDVMQFIHLGRRTGILKLQRRGEEAEVTFHRGAILWAWTPQSKRLGELLLEEGLISSEDLAAAVHEHETSTPRRTFGQVLLTTTPLPVEEVRNALKRQIERTILELVAWSHGSFAFEVDAVRPIDDVSVYPSDLIPNLDLNTQMVLLEAARVFDERNRLEGDDEVISVATAAVPQEDPDSLERGIAELGAGSSVAPPKVRLHLFSDDGTFDRDLVGILGGEVECVLHSLATGGRAAERGAIVVFDLRRGAGALAALQRVVCEGVGLTVIAVVRDPQEAGEAYGAGATAVVPWDQPEAVRACVGRISALRRPTPRVHDTGPLNRSGFAKLRRVVSDLRSGVFSATVALNLMNIVAESVERAVLFLVRGEELVALGAFGFSRDRRPLAETTRGLTLPAKGPHALARAIDQGHAMSVPFDQAALPGEMAQLLGRPRSGQVAIFPVMGTNRVILVIYTDNGELDRAIEEIEILDLVAAEVGIAFENELLRQQLARGGGR